MVERLGKVAIQTSEFFAQRPVGKNSEVYGLLEVAHFDKW